MKTVQRLNNNGRIKIRLRYSLAPKSRIPMTLNLLKNRVVPEIDTNYNLLGSIEQLQFTGAESFSNSSVKSKLALNHPCKELVWVVQHEDAETNKNHFDFTDNGDGGSDPLQDAKLQLNGHDRFSTRKAGYFNLVNYARKSKILNDFASNVVMVY